MVNIELPHGEEFAKFTFKKPEIEKSDLTKKIAELQEEAKKRAEDIKTKYDELFKLMSDWKISDKQYKKDLFKQINNLYNNESGGIKTIVESKDPIDTFNDTIYKAITEVAKNARERIDRITKLENSSDLPDPIKQARLSALGTGLLESEGNRTITMNDWRTAHTTDDWESIASQRLEQTKKDNLI